MGRSGTSSVGGPASTFLASRNRWRGRASWWPFSLFPYLLAIFFLAFPFCLNLPLGAQGLGIAPRPQLERLGTNWEWASITLLIHRSVPRSKGSRGGDLVAQPASSTQGFVCPVRESSGFAAPPAPLPDVFDLSW